MKDSKEFYKDKVLALAEELQAKRLEKRGLVVQDVEPVYVIYARRSTKAPKNKDQEDKKDKQERSVQDQIDACKEYAERNNLKWVAIEREEESAHKSNKRDTFYKILDNIREGTVYNSILAWHPDRLARNMKDSGTIMDLVDAGVIVDLQFPAFTFTNDPSGKMALGIQFVLAKNYSDGLSVTTARGIDRSTEEGKYMGKSKHGYSPDKNKLFRPNKDFEKVRKIWLEALNGRPSRELEKFSKQIGYPMGYKAILNMLHEPFYAGIYIHGNVTVDMESVDPKFTPMVSYKEFIEIDRTLGEKQSFEYSDKVENILFKKMVKCTHCNRSMSPYKSKNKYGDYYYYVGCTNKDCTSKATRKIKSAIRGQVVVDYMLKVFENNLSVTKESYEQALSKYNETRGHQIEVLESSIKTIRGQIVSLQNNIDGLAKSLSKANSKSEVTITESINTKSEELQEKREELEQLEEEMIRIESKISDDAMSYESFSNFFRNARTTIESNTNVYLLDQLVRNVFLNFFVEDGKVVGHRLKEPFATYEKMGWDIWGG